jgi:hypothetical protein
MEIGKAIGGRVVTFNAGSSPVEIARSLKDKAICTLSNSELCKRLKNMTHYSTGIDPISFATNFLHGSKHVAAESLTNPHGLSNFSTGGSHIRPRKKKPTAAEKMEVWKNEPGWK